MEPLVIIPARGNSKGIPGKNIRILGDKPLIQYTIEAARAIFEDQNICVSTDDIEIKKVAERTGLKVPFLRPSELATDTAGTVEVLLHALDFYEKQGYCPDTIVLLQPTSPLRNEDHIREAIKLYHIGVDMVVSVTESKSNPYFNLFEEDDNGFLRQSKIGNYTRRQDTPVVWEYNGAIYIINVLSLKRYKNFSEFPQIIKYPMSELYSVDLDTELDWQFLEFLILREQCK